MSTEEKTEKSKLWQRKPRAIKAIFLSNTHKVLVVYFLSLLIFLTFVFPKQFIEANKNLSNDITLSIKTSLSRIFSTIDSQYRLLVESREMIDALENLKKYSDAEEKNTIEMLTMYSNSYDILSKHMAETSFRYNDVISSITFVVGELEIQSGEKYSIKEYVENIDKESIIFSGTNMIKKRQNPSREYFLKFPMYNLNGEFLGSVCFFINASQHNLIFKDSNVYIINDNDNTLMFYNDENPDSQLINDWKKYDFKSDKVKYIDGKRYYFTESKIKIFNWTVINAVSVENFFAMTSQVNKISILIFIFLYLIIFVLIHLYSGIFSQRISKIIYSLDDYLQRKRLHDSRLFEESQLYKKLSKAINKYSLRKTSLIFNTVIILIPILFVSGLAYIRCSIEADREFGELMEILSRYNKYSIENTLNDYNHIVRSVLTSDSLKKDLKSYSEMTDNTKKLEKYEGISSELNKLMVNNMFFDFSFYDVDGNERFTWPFENYGIIDNVEFVNANVAVKNERTQKYIYNIIRKMIVNNNKQTVGYGVVGIEEDFLVGSLNKITSCKSYYFSDANNKIFLSADADSLEKDINEYTLSLKSDKYLFFEEIPENNMKMCMVFSDTDLNVFKLKLFLQLLILTVVIYLIVILGTNKSFNYIVDTITTVKESLKNNENTLSNSKNGDELDELVDAVNNMKKRVNTLINEVYIHKINEKDLELKAIQAQITPHFLYNTLEIISALVDLGDERASDLILLLSKFLRQGISRGQRMITIGEEIEYTDLYLEMQHLILEDNLVVNLDIKDELKCYKTENFLLQPIIENCLKHGQYSEDELRLISIKIYSVGEYIKINVKDNGKGMERSELEEIRKYLYDKGEVLGRIGLKNIHERLRIHFGENAGVCVYSSKNKGTIVSLKIPKIQ